MNPRMLHESTMLNIARALAQPERLRPLLDKYPEISYFGDRFEMVETALRDAQEDIDATRRERIEKAKSTRSKLERHHDRVIRQTHLCLEMYQQSDHLDLVAIAGRLLPVVLPYGRGLTRFSVGRKIGEGYNADERLDDADRQDLQKLALATETALDLHGRRMALVAELELVQDRLNAFDSEDLEKGARLVEARARFVQLILAFRTTVRVAEIGEEDTRRLLAPLENEMEALEARRARVLAREPRPEPTALVSDAAPEAN